MDIETPIVAKLTITHTKFVEAMGSSEFYTEILLIAAALTLSVMLIGIIRRYTRKKLEHASSEGGRHFLLCLLPLLDPLAVILLLSLIRPAAEQMAASGMLTDAFISLAFTWLIVRTVFLVVHTRPVAWFIVVVLCLLTLLNITGLLKLTTAYLGSMAFEFGKYQVSMLGLVKGLISFVIVFWLAGVLSKNLEQTLRRRSALSYNSRELIVKLFTVLVYFIAIVMTLGAVGVDLTAFAVFGGALGVGIGLGLQKITANFVSGIVILLERSIKIGDMIEIGATSGTVRQLNMRFTLVETSDGRELLVPNEELMTTRLTNWTYSNASARVEIITRVSYTSDATKARELMLEAATSHPRCLKDPPATCFLREFAENGMVFSLRFWIPDVHDGRLGPQSEVMFDILKRFGKNNIRIAYDPAKSRDVAQQEAELGHEGSALPAT